MIEPEPGKAFEYHGLRFEPQEDPITPTWFALVGEYQLNLRASVRANGQLRWSVLSGNFYFTSAEQALAWGVRVCLGASCDSCAQQYDVGGRLFCSARNSFEPEDGFCHLWWSAKQ
jgi:hypothetical protein